MEPITLHFVVTKNTGTTHPEPTSETTMIGVGEARGARMFLNQPKLRYDLEYGKHYAVTFQEFSAGEAESSGPQWSSQPPHKPGVWASKRPNALEKWDETQVHHYPPNSQCFSNPSSWVWSPDAVWAFIGQIPAFKPTPPLLPCKTCGKFPEPVKSGDFFAYNHHGSENQERGVVAHQVSTVFRKTQAESDNDWNTINA